MSGVDHAADQIEIEEVRRGRRALAERHDSRGDPIDVGQQLAPQRLRLMQADPLEGDLRAYGKASQGRQIPPK